MFARLVLISLLAFGCEKTSHENLDKGTHTQNGAAKLKKALADEPIDPDLSAHAAANMIKKGSDPEARQGLEARTAQRRIEAIAKLAPRLWDNARADGED